MENYNNVLDYPQMTRQREDSIQAKNIAYAEDVNIEFDHIVDTYNQLIRMLTGEWGDGTGKIYELVDTAIKTANQALNQTKLCILKSGDTMTGQLNTELTPVSDYNMVNKRYVDNTIVDKLADPINRITNLETFRDKLKAEQVKLENTNFKATNVHDGMSELFISVSSGKRLVAAAITGKGVETAGDASFSQMADNINAILTFVDGTSGGTAKPEEIFKGKTAYARGQLLVGTFTPPPSMADSNATGADLLIGKVAYTKDGRIIGRLDPSIWAEGGITVGTDTSDATAYSSDILRGKTAYARGQKLIGTLTNMDVEEIYGFNPEDMTTKKFKTIRKDPITKQKIDSRKKIAFSKDGRFSVSYTEIEGEKYIESYAIDDDGFYIQKGGSINGGGDITRKYRYALSDLKIPTKEDILNIGILPPPFNGSDSKAALVIISRDNDAYCNYINVFTYNLYGSGVIDTSGLATYIRKKIPRYPDDEQAAVITFNNTSKLFYVISTIAYRVYTSWYIQYKCNKM